MDCATDLRKWLQQVFFHSIKSTRKRKISGPFGGPSFRVMTTEVLWAVLPPLSQDFADKIIYLKCYQPLEPYHDGSDEHSREFWNQLVAAIPAFLHKIETLPLPDEFRKCRFYVKEFHHPEIVELISGASPVASLGELITKWLTDIAHDVEGPASDLFEQLKHWYRDHYDEKTLSGYSSGSSHFGHQLRALSELPGWSKRIFRSDRRVGEHRSSNCLENNPWVRVVDSYANI
jgi:hypothetical protein